MRWLSSIDPLLCSKTAENFHASEFNVKKHFYTSFQCKATHSLNIYSLFFVSLLFSPFILLVNGKNVFTHSIINAAYFNDSKQVDSTNITHAMGNIDWNSTTITAIFIFSLLCSCHLFCVCLARNVKLRQILQKRENSNTPVHKIPIHYLFNVFLFPFLFGTNCIMFSLESISLSSMNL